MENLKTHPTPSESVESHDEAQLRARSRKYMIFTVAGERFATQLADVKEVIGLTQITPIPNVPPYFKGLINLRGKIITIVDLREKLNVKQAAASKKPCIIISEIMGITVGTIVDDVLEVSGVNDSQIERDLDISSQAARSQIVGAIRFQDRPLTLIVDMAKTINIQELVALRTAAPPTEVSSSPKAA